MFEKTLQNLFKVICQSMKCISNRLIEIFSNEVIFQQLTFTCKAALIENRFFKSFVYFAETTNYFKRFD